MTEASSREGEGSDTDSVDSLGPRARHPTWSHSQHQAGHRHTASNQEQWISTFLLYQEHRRKMSQFRLRATSVSKATQTGAQEDDQEDQYVDDVEVVADGEVEAAVVEDRENMVITSSCTDYDEEHGLVSLNEETTCF